MKYPGSNNGWYWSRTAAALGAAPIYISNYRKHQRRATGAAMRAHAVCEHLH